MRPARYFFVIQLSNSRATAFSDGLGTEEKIWKLMGEL